MFDFIIPLATSLVESLSVLPYISNADAVVINY